MIPERRETHEKNPTSAPTDSLEVSRLKYRVGKSKQNLAVFLNLRLVVKKLKIARICRKEYWRG